MGVPPEWRKMLLDMLAARAAAAGTTAQQCWSATLPPHEQARPFDIVILDGMQELAVIKHGNPPSGAGTAWTGADIGKRMKRAAYSHLATPDAANSEIEAARMLIVCLDNPYATPRNKAFVQSARDTTPMGAGAGGDGAANEEAGEGPMDARGYDMACARASELLQHAFDDKREFLLGPGPLPVAPASLWRSAAVRWQLTRLVTEALLTTYVPEGKLLLFDEGLPLTETRYAALREQMLAEHREAFERNSAPPFEDATLVGHLMSSCVRRVLLQHGHRFTELPATGLGEADHKILYYVQRRAPMGVHAGGGKGRRVRYLVKCQDTDVMWALMLHMRTLINPDTGNVDEVDVWLDTQTPRDRADGLARDYRFINVVELWRQTHRFLREEFPTLENPLEALCAVVFCNRNDYIEPFPGRFRVGPDKIWRTFAGALALAAGHAKYPVGAKRFTVSAQLPAQLCRALPTLVVAEERPDCGGRAIADADGALAHDAPLYLRRGALVQFFYYMLQTSPEIRGAAERHKGTQWAQRLDTHIAEPAELLEVIAHLHELDTATTGMSAEAVAATAGRVPPPLYEVPTVAAMEARCARIEWTLNYYCSGWKTPEYTQNWFRKGGELSLHGWDAEDVTGAVHTNPDSFYLFAAYIPGEVAPDGERLRCGTYRYHAPRVTHDVHTATHA
jgi:hypothetical protein